MPAKADLIAVFFQKYADLFQAFDAAGITDCYCFPMAFHQEDGSLLNMDRATFLAGAIRLTASYKERGVVTIDFEISGCRRLNPGTLLVDLIWHLRDGSGGLIQEFEIGYILSGPDQELLISHVILRNERLSG